MNLFAIPGSKRNLGNHLNQFLSCALILACAPVLQTPIAAADLPDAPVILEATAGGCSPGTETCGDGIDQDCDGSDLACPGADKDNDGYTTNDCDDSNRKVYPGIYVPCTVSGTPGTQLCQSNGAYSACSATPLCEATGSGHCYYVSKLTGDDNNPGTFSQPLKTYMRFNDYYCAIGSSGCPGDSGPSNKITLQAGDVVYFMSGLYNESFNYYNGERHGLFIRNRVGTSSDKIMLKAYPGAIPVFSPGTQAFGLSLRATNYVVLEGIEIAKAYGAGIYIQDDADHVEIRNMWIHDTDGEDNNNIAGLLLHVNNVDVHNNLIHDNYDRTNADTGGIATENSRDIVIFGGGGHNHFHHNVIFQTPATTAPKTGSCLVYKHGSTDTSSIFEVDHNTFWNCLSSAIGTASRGGRIHHNLILDSDNGVYLHIYGQPTPPNLADNIIENNTFVRTRPFQAKPSEVYEYSGGTVGSMTFRNNVVFDNRTAYNADIGGVYNIDNYALNTVYNTVVGGGLLSFSNNCFYNPNTTVMFSLFAQNGSSNINLGGFYNFAQWQSLGYDSGSTVVNPAFDQFYRSTVSPCSGRGISAP